MVKHGGHLWHAHPGVRTGDNLTAGERAADFLKKWFGTWTALFGVGAAIAVWILLQKTSIKWDIYPFILLNLCLSCLAAVQGIILQISANRGDRISAEVALHTEGNTDTLLDVNRQQLEILTKLNGLDTAVDGLAEAVRGAMAARAEHDKTVAADAKASRTSAEAALAAVQAAAAPLRPPARAPRAPRGGA